MGGVVSRSGQTTHSVLFRDAIKINHYGIRQQVVILSRFKSSLLTDVAPEEDYQCFRKSIIPTYHFQASLPRLPIPELAKTCERYLRAQKPLLSVGEHSKTKSYVDHFLKKEGAKAQNALIAEDKTNSHTSYITQPWFDMYLTDRKPLPINYNPFLVFVDYPDPQYNSQLLKATNLVISSLRFYKSLHEETLEPEVFFLNPKHNSIFFRNFTKSLPKAISWYGAYLFKAFPLDMSQYSNLFNTTRIPVFNEKDTIKHVDGKRHLLIMKGGNFYVLDVLKENGDIMSPDVILSGIEQVLKDKDPVTPYPVGILTTEDRNVWATARKHLEKLGNSEVLDLIDTALFNLVLDDASPGGHPVNMVRVYLHADGTNRWFDKSFSLIVAQDGTAGINFEHSWGDGVAVLRYFNDVYRDSFKTPRAHQTTRRSNPPLRKLEFKLDDKAKNFIREAKEKYNKTCEALEIRVLDYKKYGRHMCNSVRVSPDALMQLAFQIAHDQVAHRQVATYESCSTAAFKHGRTEAVRPCTVETQNVCKALRESNTSKKELQNMIHQCSKTHSRLIKEAAMGQGFDRHLFALKLKVEELGLKADIFNDPAYHNINYNILSTSTLASDCLQLGAFGPVVPDGYGVGYSIWSDRLGSIVTNYNGQSDGAGLIEALEHTLDRLNDILKA